MGPHGLEDLRNCRDKAVTIAKTVQGLTAWYSSTIFLLVTPYHCSFENEARTKPSKLPKVFFPHGRMAAAKGLGGNSKERKQKGHL